MGRLVPTGNGIPEPGFSGAQELGARSPRPPGICRMEANRPQAHCGSGRVVLAVGCSLQVVRSRSDMDMLARPSAAVGPTSWVFGGKSPQQACLCSSDAPQMIPLWG